MEASEKSEIKEKSKQISELMGGDVDSLYRALEIAEGITDDVMRSRLTGEVISRLTLTLEAEGTPEAIAESERLKKEFKETNNDGV